MLIRRLLLVLVWLTCSSLAHARTSQITLSLGLSSDLLPTMICIQTPKISKKLLDAAQDFGSFAVSPRARNTGVVVTQFAPACETKGPCDSCAIPSGRPGGVMCMVTDGYDGPSEASGEERDLQLDLENAGVVSMQMHGADIVLDVEIAEGVPPRVTTVGGAYQHGVAQRIPLDGTLSLPLRNRCVMQLVRYTASATYQPDVKPTLYDEKKSIALHVEERTLEGVEALLVVPEPEQTTNLRLVDGDDEYVGSFSYPADRPVELRATLFNFKWQKSAFVTGRRGGHIALWKGNPNQKKLVDRAYRDECPSVSLPRAANATCTPTNHPTECSYECASRQQPIEFPATVEFKLEAPLALAGADAIVWQDQVKYSNALLTSYQKPEDRRIYVIWPKELQTTLGSEWDAVELVGADGKVHRLAQDPRSISVPGVGTPANFSYHYLGRSPYKTQTLTAEGDLLTLKEPSATRQRVLLSFQGHFGALVRSNTDANHKWSPIADLALTVRWNVHWEGSVIGAFTWNPSSTRQVGDQSERWESSGQLRGALLASYRLQSAREQYWTFGIGGGFTTNALASDWSKSGLFGVGLAQIRYGYEFTDSLAFEPFLECWYPERYPQYSQDSAGPHTPTVKRGVSIAFGLGIRWEAL